MRRVVGYGRFEYSGCGSGFHETILEQGDVLPSHYRFVIDARLGVDCKFIVWLSKTMLGLQLGLHLQARKPRRCGIIWTKGTVAARLPQHPSKWVWGEQDGVALDSEMVRVKRMGAEQTRRVYADTFFW